MLAPRFSLRLIESADPPPTESKATLIDARASVCLQSVEG
jgi:hypothetical protein